MTGEGKPTVFVTGGAGFIGSHLVGALLNAGHEVVVYDNFSTGRRELLPPAHPHLRVVQGSLLDETLLPALRHAAPAVVFHLAALHYIPYCNDHPVETVQVNTAGTEAVLAGCRTVRPSRVVFASSAAVYPPHEGPCGEDLPSGPVDIYGWSKVFGEGLLRHFVRDTGIPAVAARLFNVFGPGETNPHLIPEVLAQVREGKRRLRLGNVTPRRDFVYVSDVGRALREIADAPIQGMAVFNVGSGREYAVTDVVAAIGSALDVDLHIETDPARVRPVDRPHLLADIRRIKDHLGWEPQLGLEEGIRGIVEAEGCQAPYPLRGAFSPTATGGGSAPS